MFLASNKYILFDRVYTCIGAVSVMDKTLYHLWHMQEQVANISYNSTLTK